MNEEGRAACWEVITGQKQEVVRSIGEGGEVHSDNWAWDRAEPPEADEPGWRWNGMEASKCGRVWQMRWRRDRVNINFSYLMKESI